MSNDEDLQALIREIARAKKDKFTGSVVIELGMNQGGIGQMSIATKKKVKI